MLAVLVMILIFNTLDRYAIGLVLQDVKAEFQLNDTQLGLLTGIAFSLFYSVMGIPIARAADRMNRVHIVVATTAVWSVAVASCGLARNFVQLLLMRTVVAIGEAGCLPPAHSLIADKFSRAERPRAMGLYMLGVPVGAALGYLIGGWVTGQYGWRVTFFALGLPGLAFALLAWATLSEPRATAARSDTVPVTETRNLLTVLVVLWRIVTFRHLVIGNSLLAVFNYGMVIWKPAFFQRSFGMDTVELGVRLAAIYIICGTLGTWLGGELASRRTEGGERGQLQLAAAALVAFGGLSACLFLAPSAGFAFGALALASIAGGLVVAPLFATVQSLVPDDMRAVAVALLNLFAILVGMGAGPLVAGALSDFLYGAFGQESLRYSLLALCPGFAWAAWHLWRASRFVTAEIADRVEAV